MAQLKLDSLSFELLASALGYVVKRSPQGLVLSRKPDMSRVKPSNAQKAQRKRMRAAAEHYREVMKDPIQAARWRDRAAREKMPVSALIMGAYLKSSPKG